MTPTSRLRLHDTDFTTPTSRHRLHDTDFTTPTSRLRLHDYDSTTTTPRLRIHDYESTTTNPRLRLYDYESTALLIIHLPLCQVIYPGKTTRANCFRIGNIGELYPEDMRHLLKCVKEVLTDMGIPVPLS
uniref:Uncharacterized protein n=1 Tax=Timema tahoe TaxID=61484 RepID=A0A7R9IF61_9NEOP|nr:unnamed protein product [Timema tahoe]